GERRVHAAVVELDALADPVRPAAENDDLAPRFGVGLALAGLVGGIEVRRVGSELGATGIDRLVDPPDAGTRPERARVVLADAHQFGEPVIGEPHALPGPQPLAALGLEAGPALPRDRRLGAYDLLDVAQEPAVDLRERLDLLDRVATPERVADQQEPLRVGCREPLAQAFV